MTFSIGEAISFGWETFKRRPGILVGAFVVIFLIEVGMGFGQSIVSSREGVIAAILSLAFSVGAYAVSLLINVGTVNFVLHAHDAVDSVKIRHLWCPAPVWRYLGLTLLFFALFGTAALVGYTLTNGLEQPAAAALIIVSSALVIYIGIVVLFAPYVVVDRGAGPIQAIRESARLTRGQRGPLFLFLLVIGGINLLGVLLLVIGLLVTLPVSALATVHVYRKLS